MKESRLIEIIKKSALPFREHLILKKTHGNVHQSGLPDFTGCFDGQRIDIEVKINPNTPTLQQYKVLYDWSVVKSYSAVITYISSLDYVYLIPVWKYGVMSKPWKEWTSKKQRSGIPFPTIKRHNGKISLIDLQPMLDDIKNFQNG